MADDDEGRRWDVLPILVLVGVVVVMLVGWWLYPSLQRYMFEQDCVATGRTNCR